MLDIQLLRADIDGVAARLRSRGFELDVAEFKALEAERKAVQTRTQELQATRNSLSKSIGIAKSRGEDVAPIMAQVAGLGDELKAAEEKLAYLQASLQELLAGVPNLPHESVPIGRNSDDNVEVSRWARRAPSISRSGTTSTSAPPWGSISRPAPSSRARVFR